MISVGPPPATPLGATSDISIDDATVDSLTVTGTDGIVASGNGGKDTLALSNTTADVGLTIGADTNLYRSAANALKTDDSLAVGSNIALSVADGSVSANYFLTTSSNGIFSTGPVRFSHNVTDGGGYLEGQEQASDPAAPSAGFGRIYLKDNGSGKTQLAVRFASGAVQIVATEP